MNHAAEDCPKRIEVTCWGDEEETYIHGDCCMTDLTKRRIYLAGPMTGLPAFNYTAFHEAAWVLRENEKNVVINPAENYGGDTTHARWMYINKSVDQIQGLARLMYSSNDECMVVTLDGWQESSGARLEVDLAHQLGLDVYELNCVFSPHWETDCRLVPGKREAHPGVAPNGDALREAMERLKRHKAINDTEPKRAAILDEAKSLICGDRNNQYGPPGKDFNRAANALTSLGFGKENHDGSGCEVLSDHDISIIMIVLKLSRLMWSPTKRDSWVDVAGYAGCGAEVAGAE